MISTSLQQQLQGKMNARKGCFCWWKWNCCLLHQLVEGMIVLLYLIFYFLSLNSLSQKIKWLLFFKSILKSRIVVLVFIAEMIVWKFNVFKICKIWSNLKIFAVMSHISHLKKKRTISNQMVLFKFKSIFMWHGP